MLSELTRKLCPLLTLALTTVGCGKKIGDPKSDPGHSTQNQEPSSNVNLSLDGTVGASKVIYTMPRNGRFELPDQLRVSGNTFNTSVEIKYDVDPEDNGNFEFKCSYLVSGPDTMRLNKCESWYGGDYGDVSDQVFGFKKDMIFEIHFSSGRSEDFRADAHFNMTWL